MTRLLAVLLFTKTTIFLLSSTPVDAVTGAKTLQDYLSHNDIFDPRQLAFNGVKFVAVDISQNTTASIFSFQRMVIRSKNSVNVKGIIRIFLAPKNDVWGDEIDDTENYENFLALGSWDIDLTPGVNVIERIDSVFDVRTLLPQRITSGGIEVQFLFLVTGIVDRTKSLSVADVKSIPLIDWSKLHNAHFQDFKICYFH